MKVTVISAGAAGLTCALVAMMALCVWAVSSKDRAHFEFISLGATMGLMQATLQTEVPITFGIITTYTDEQAIARSSDDGHNKGREAAVACVESMEALATIKAPV